MTLAELIADAATAAGPATVARGKISPGGVDPLGLRQINFQLMDLVLPELNNVARRLRPFIVLPWAWRRVREVVETSGSVGETDERLRDFVDRIEAIYAWSQFLVRPNTDLPGGQALRPIMTASEYRFGDLHWQRLRDLRRSSTGLISPLNYGPGLRSMQWLLPTEVRGVFRDNPIAKPALDAFESTIASELSHPAFSQLGEVVVQAEDVRRWGEMWALDGLTDTEREVGFARLSGPDARLERQRGLALVKAAHRSLGDDGPVNKVLRSRMSEKAPNWTNDPTILARVEIWRRVQVRQVFRLALEGMLHWVIGHLAQKGGRPATSAELARAFLDDVLGGNDIPAADWLAPADRPVDPGHYLDEMSAAIKPRSGQSTPAAIAEALAFCVREAPATSELFEAPDRLPLARAARDFRDWASHSRQQCIINVIERWVMAQHAYWSVGRGLADARQRGKTLLRLKVVMDEGGWTLTPGTKPGNPPVPTPDRLETAVALLEECGQMS